MTIETLLLHLRERVVVPLLIGVTALLGVGLAGRLLAATDLVSVTLATERWLEGMASHFVVLAFFALHVGLGSLVLRSLSLDDRFPGWSERIVCRLTAGLFVSAIVLTLLCLIGLLGGWSAALYAVALTVANAAFVWPHLDLRPPQGGPPNAAYFTLAAVLLVAAGLLWMYPIYLQTLLPNWDWDSAVYHLPLAQRFLEGLLWNTDPLHSAHSYPGGVSMFYAFFMALGFDGAVVPFNLVVTCLIVVAAYALGRRFWGAGAGLWAAGISASSHILWQLAIDPRIDNFLGLFVTIALFCLLAWWREPSRRGYLYLMAMSLNLAIGSKYTAVVFCVYLLLVVFAVAVHRRAAHAESVGQKVPLLLALCLLVPNGVWYGANYVIHGDPLYHRLKGHYYVDSSGTEKLVAASLEPHLNAQAEADPAVRERLSALDREYPRQRAEASEPKHLFDVPDMMRRPQKYARKPNHFLSPFLLLFPLLPLVSRSRESWFLLATGLLLYVFFSLRGPLFRYAIPLVPALSVGAGVVLALPRGRIGRVALSARGAALWHGAWAVLLLSLLAHNGMAQYSLGRDLRVDEYLKGAFDHSLWLRKVGYNFAPPMPNVVHFVNGEIREGRMHPSDKIFMIGEAKGHLLGCDYLPDSTRKQLRWLAELLKADFDHARLYESLRRQGVTHVLYYRGYYRWVLKTTSTDRTLLALGMVHADRFLESYGTIVYSEWGMRLARIGDAATGT
jgi:hypothetical protein